MLRRDIILNEPHKPSTPSEQLVTLIPIQSKIVESTTYKTGCILDFITENQDCSGVVTNKNNRYNNTNY